MKKHFLAEQYQRLFDKNLINESDQKRQDLLNNGEFSVESGFAGFDDGIDQLLIDLRTNQKKAEVAEALNILSDTVSYYQDVWRDGGHTTDDWIEYHYNVDGVLLDEWYPTEEETKEFLMKFPNHELVTFEKI